MLIKLSVKMIKFYQKYLSLNACPFIPSCSQYAIEALLKHGFFYGWILSIWRIIRCNPFNKNVGFDKVPDKKKDLIWVY